MFVGSLVRHLAGDLVQRIGWQAARRGDGAAPNATQDFTGDMRDELEELAAVLPVKRD